MVLALFHWRKVLTLIKVTYYVLQVNVIILFHAKRVLVHFFGRDTSVIRRTILSKYFLRNTLCRNNRARLSSCIATTHAVHLHILLNMDGVLMEMNATIFIIPEFILMVNYLLNCFVWTKTFTFAVVWNYAFLLLMFFHQGLVTYKSNFEFIWVITWPCRIMDGIWHSAFPINGLVGTLSLRHTLIQGIVAHQNSIIATLDPLMFVDNLVTGLNFLHHLLILFMPCLLFKDTDWNFRTINLLWNLNPSRRRLTSTLRWTHQHLITSYDRVLRFYLLECFQKVIQIFITALNLWDLCKIVWSWDGIQLNWIFKIDIFIWQALIEVVKTDVYHFLVFRLLLLI